MATIQPSITDLCLDEGTRTTNIAKATAGHSAGTDVVNVNLDHMKSDGYVARCDVVGQGWFLSWLTHLSVIERPEGSVRASRAVAGAPPAKGWGP